MSTTATDVNTPIRKFMFDRSFDHETEEMLRARAAATFSEAQVEAAKKEAHDTGLSAGKSAALEEQSIKIKGVIEQIATSVAKLVDDAEANRQKSESRLREAVLAVARKLLPEFNQKHGLQEVEAVVTKTIGEMTSEPRLVVRVNDAQFDAIDTAVKSITEKEGYAGKVVLLADAEVATNDCRVEWADGGIERNVEALWQDIGKTLAPGQSQQPASSDAAG